MSFCTLVASDLRLNSELRPAFTGERKKMEEEESVKRGKEEKHLFKAICTNLYSFIHSASTISQTQF